MNRSLYGERDYGFGQRILALRTQMGLTQAGLAERLHVSRRAVTVWEAGESYPKAEHLQHVITLAVRASAFPLGREEEEIRAFWKAAHQKVLLDEAWLASLLGRTHPALTLLPPVPLEAPRPGELPAAQPPPGPRLDWGEALAVPSFYDREQELATLARWVVEEGCRLVSALGLGGIGKSALAVRAMRQLAGHFEVVLFRSLRDAPSCEALLESCLLVLSPEPLALLPQSLERRLSLLLGELRSRRVLLMLDNLEVLLEEGEVRGHLRPGFEAYEHLLRQIAQTAHQSCLLLTSREQPAALRALEGSRTLVRSLRLSGLEATACEQLLAEHEVTGSPQEQARLGQIYAGNPLALNIVAETIADLFGGAIDQFLAGGTTIFGSITELLDEQWSRLSPQEQTVLSWLAILREPVTLDDLLAVLVTPLSRGQVLEAVDGLRRRSLIERGQRVGNFTLQSVVLEYVTTKLVTTASEEIGQGRLLQLREHSLEQAQAKEYVRQTQERLLLAPLLARLQSACQGRAEVEGQLRAGLDALRERAEEGYGPANLVALLRVLRGDLRGLDLSRLTLRSLYLQGVEMQDTSLAGAHLEKVVFSEAFDAIFSVAISPDGRYWAAGSNSGEIRIWREEGQTARAVMRAHTHAVAAVAFSPDGRMLASGSWDCTAKLWDVAGKALVWNFQGHHGYVQSVAFRPDGALLASGSDDGTIKLWDLHTGSCLRTLRGHQDNVYKVVWHPDGHQLASGSFDRTIRIWDGESGECLRTLSGHASWVMAVAFRLDGKLLASGGADNMVKLWEAESGRSLQTLPGHTGTVTSVAWSSDGRTLVSGSYDTTIKLWQPGHEMRWQTLSGHTDIIRSVAITPDGNMVLSGSEDRTLRLWEISSGQCLRILQGYSVTLYAVAWSPDSRFLASGGSDCTITLWESASKSVVKSLKGHTQAVYTLAWHPNGRLLASGGYDRTVCIWDSTTGERLHVFRADTSQVTSVAWSPDGAWLASTSYDQVVRMWDMSTRTCRWVGHAHTSLVHAVCWSPDGSRLATCSGDNTVRLWQAEDGTLLSTFQGHGEDVASVAWSPDGRRVASGGGGGGRGELLLWDVESGHFLRSLVGHPSHVFAIAWSPQGDILVSASIDGTLRWWDVESGECLHTREGHQGWISSLAISSNGEMLASCGHDGVTHLWEMSSAGRVSTLRGDRPYERLSLGETTGLTQAQKTTLRALGAIDVPDEEWTGPLQSTRDASS